MSTINQIQDWINDLGQCKDKQSIKNWVGEFPGKIADTTMDAYKNIIMYDIPSVDKYINKILNDGVPEDKNAIVSAIYAGLITNKYQNPKNITIPEERESILNDVIEDKQVGESIDNKDTLDKVNDLNKNIESNTEELGNDYPSGDVNLEPRKDDPVTDKLTEDNIDNKVKEELIEESVIEQQPGATTSEVDAPSEHPSQDDITENMKKVEDVSKDEENFSDDPYAPTEQGIIRRLQKPIENFMGRIYNFMKDPDFRPIISAVVALGYAGAQYSKFFENILAGAKELGKASTKVILKEPIYANKTKLLKLLLWCAKNWKMITATAALTASLPALYTAIGRLMSKDPSFGQNKDYAEFVAKEYAKLYPAKYKQYTQYRFSELNKTMSEKNLSKMLFDFSIQEDIIFNKLINNKDFNSDEIITMLTGSGYDLSDAIIKKAYLLKIINDPFFRERMATYVFSDIPEDMKVVLMEDNNNFSSGVSNAISGVAKSEVPNTSELLRRLTDIAEANEAANYTDTVTRAVKANKK